MFDVARQRRDTGFRKLPSAPLVLLSYGWRNSANVPPFTAFQELRAAWQTTISFSVGIISTMECHLSGHTADKNIADVVPVSQSVGWSVGPPGIPAARLNFCRWQKRGGCRVFDEDSRLNRTLRRRGREKRGARKC